MTNKRLFTIKNDFMKRVHLFAIIMCMAITSALAQRTYTFNAVALNVDGLPPKILVVNLNVNGPQESGTSAIGKAIVRNGWDFVGLSEDFNYHDYLTAETGAYYNAAAHGGTVTGASNATDGLGFLCTKSMSFTQVAKVGWNVNKGDLLGNLTEDNGADELIDKGFRMFVVTIAEGVEVDVYVLHMDAASRAADIEARESQLAQLAAYIKNTNNKRPILVIGDTNCRYTRERLETGFIDVINADSRFTIKDAWVEHMWGGVYPTYGAPSMMVDEYGYQKGEVVDKIFYINNTESDLQLVANSYHQEETVKISDHYPVVVNFSIIDPDGEPVSNDGWTVEGGAIDDNAGSSTGEVLEGELATNGVTYFIQNVATGKYIKRGAGNGNQAVEGSAGTPITLQGSNGSFTLKTLWGAIGTQEYPFMDQSGTWTLEVVPGTTYQYYIKCDAGVLSSTGNMASNGYSLQCVPQDDMDDSQKWVLLTPERLKTEMLAASGAKAFDITPLIYAADFDKGDESNAASHWSGFSNKGFAIGGVEGTADNNEEKAKYSYTAASVSTDEISLTQTIEGLPAGKYRVSCQGYYRSRGKYGIGSNSDETLTATLSFGSGSGNIAQATTIPIPTENDAKNVQAAQAAATYFAGGKDYVTSFTTTESAGDKTLKIYRAKNGYWTSKSAMLCVDNVVIEYLGTKSAEDIKADVKRLVANHINRTALKVAQLNAAGQAAYDISVVLYRYHNDLLSSDGKLEIAIIDAAYAVAWAAHQQQLIDDAIKGNGDVTFLIKNPSFESGNLTGWSVSSTAGNVNVYPNSGSVSGCHGSYLFSANNGNANHTASIKQSLKCLRNGLYELKASVTSDQGNYVYLTADSYHSAVQTQDNGTFKEATLYFLVESGSVTIGAIGGNKGAGLVFKHYWPWEGCCFKADNFRLRYVCDLPHGRLKLALMDAENASLDAYGVWALNIRDYQDSYENKSLMTNGVQEATAIYSALQTAAKAQRTAGADMTWAITNPNFETGDYRGWTCTTAGWETKVASQENATYVVAGTNGRYLFNTWNEGSAEAVTQTITDIPNGTYKVSAMVTSDADKTINLTANGVTEGIVIPSNGASSGVFPEVTCQVTNGTLSIQVVGADKCWYKCDDFHLTLVMPNELVLNETDTVIAEINDVTYSKVKVNRTIKAVTKVEEGEEPNPLWSTFVAPFDIPASSLIDWDVMELVGSSKNGDNVALDFAPSEDGIKAGVPYMVRNTTMTSDLTEIIMENVSVNTSFNNSETDHVNFVGTYTDGYVPEGGCFISNNVFYQAGNSNTNRLKGFRAYLEITDPEVRSISYRIIGEEDNTGDDNTGDDNTGDDNTGDDNTGDDNTGDDNTGDDNTGDDNTGDDNTGDDNTGDDNTGDDNTGDDNTGDDNNVEDSVDSSTAVITSIAIYNTAGERLETMQVGLNVILMSDGSIIKVMVKE